MLLNIVHGDFPASHVFGKEFRPRIEWMCVCYKWVASDCFEILGINGQVISTPIGLFFVGQRNESTCSTRRLSFIKEKRADKNQHLQLPTFQKNRVQLGNRRVPTLVTSTPSTPNASAPSNNKKIQNLTLPEGMFHHRQAHRWSWKFPSGNPGGTVGYRRRFIGPMDVVLGREKCPAVFFLRDRSNFANKSSLFWWWWSEGEGRFLKIIFLRSLLRFVFFEELGLNFGDWRKSGWMMEHNVRNIKWWFRRKNSGLWQSGHG